MFVEIVLRHFRNDKCMESEGKYSTIRKQGIQW